MYIIELLSEMVYKAYKSSRSQPARLYTMEPSAGKALPQTIIFTLDKMISFKKEKIVGLIEFIFDLQ